MPARNAIVLGTDQAADGRPDTESGEVVAGDEQPAGFRAPTLVRDMCTEARVRGQPEAVVVEPLEIPEQRVTEDGVNAPAEIVRGSRPGAWTGRGHQHDLVRRRQRQPPQDQPVDRTMLELMYASGLRVSDRIA